MEDSKVDPPISTNGRSDSRIAKFGAFELRLDTGELQKYGANVRLQRRAFCVLQALLERHGEVVTREELRARLWADGTFVDYESGLNTAMNRLRAALGDSAETPIYVETLARLGYRFIAPVTFLPGAAHANGDGRKEPVREEALAPPPARFLRRPRWIMAAVSLAAMFAAALWIAHGRERHVSPAYRQLTFAGGFVKSARFLHDGKRIAFSAISRGNTAHTYVASADGKDAANPRALGSSLGDNGMAGVSPADEIALLVPGKGERWLGVKLAQPDGSKVHDLVQPAYSVDWAKDGRVARIFADDGWHTLEYPVGQKLYRSRFALSTARVSPNGRLVAFVEHPLPGDDAGQVMIVGPNEPAHALSMGWQSIDGLAWHPAGKEVWFTAATSGVDRKLRAVNLRSQVRQIAEMPGGMVLQDVNESGQVLIIRPSSRMIMLRGSLSGKGLRDISLLDWSLAEAITADGKTILFSESGDGGGSGYGVYLYRADKDAAERIADGMPLDLSADGKWILTTKAADHTKVFLISVDDHKVTPIETNGSTYNWARFLNGRSGPAILAGVLTSGQNERVIEQELPGGKSTPIADNLYMSGAVIDEGGRIAVGRGTKSGFVIVDLMAHSARPLELAKDFFPVAFASDGRLITQKQAERSVVLESVDPKTGNRRPYYELPVSDSTGLKDSSAFHFAQHQDTFVFSRVEGSSVLYLVSGWS